MYKLVICDDEGKTTIVPLIRDEISVGRLEGNTIRLTDRNVSRQHARLIRKDEVFFIEDLNSLTGTKVNGEKVEAEAKKVTPKDQITIGDYSLSIRTDVSAEVPMGRQMDPGDEAGIGKVRPNARLVMLTQPIPGKDVELTADLYVIGRSSEANFQIEHPSISRAHTRLDHGDGEWTISDLDSINGILINNLKRDDYVLKSGDIIELGSVRLRFVAPGEPYEYHPDMDLEEIEEKPSSKPLKLLYLIGAIAVVVMVAIVAFMMGEDPPVRPPKPLDTQPQDPTDQLSFGQLMEKGKDAMQSEDWSEAARLFAIALQRRPKSAVAREMKELSIKESDNQQTFNNALAALAKENWKKAVTLLSKIPRASHYYDIELLKSSSDSLCKGLLRKARKSAIKGNFVKAMQIISDIDALSEAPDSCRERQEQMRTEFEPRLPKTPGAQRPGPGRTKTPDPRPRVRFKKPPKPNQSNIDNPYDE